MEVKVGQRRWNWWGEEVKEGWEEGKMADGHTRWDGVTLRRSNCGKRRRRLEVVRGAIGSEEVR